MKDMFKEDNSKSQIMEERESIRGKLIYYQELIYQNEKTVHLTDLGKAFEWLFNIKLGDYHQKYMDVIKRKPAKLTEFLNELANLIRKEHENKGYR